MINANLLNIKNFKNWILQILMFLVYECYSKISKKLFIKYGTKDFSFIHFFAHIILILFFICLIHFVYKDKFNSIDDSKKNEFTKISTDFSSSICN